MQKSIFSRNIEALSERFPEFAKKIVTYVPNNLPELVKENDFYNLKYKGIFLHNPINPLGEAMEIFSQIPNTPVTIHLVYGIGLGYLFQYSAQNSKGSVILYEPELNILRIAFSLVDFSNEIRNKEVFITDSKSDVIEFLHIKSGVKNSPYMLSTTNYREMNKTSFDNLVEELQRVVGSNILDLKYTKEKMYPLLKSVFSNIPTLIKEPPLISIKDVYKGKTALVVSAGPTLDRNIEVMKKYRDKYVLIVVGTAVKTLQKNGITPDFIAIIESYDSSRQVEGMDLSKINFVTEPFSNYNPRKFGWKNIFSHVSENMAVNKLWAEISEQDISEYASKGSVSYTALNIARILGCSKIILVGQDLAYVEGQCYSKDSVYKDLVCAFNQELGRWEITAKDINEYAKQFSSPTEEARIRSAKGRLKNLNAALYFVKGINGDLIPTESVYAAFIKPLSDFTKEHPDRTYINTSLVGAQIDGFENMKLEDALLGSESVEGISADSELLLDKDVVRKNLEKYLNDFSNAINKIQEGQRLVKSFNNDEKRYRALTQELLKSLKKLSVHYLDMSSNYTKENKIFDIITLADKIDLDYEMKMIQELTLDSVKSIVSKISAYYDNSEKKLKEMETVFKNSIEGLK